MPQEIAIGPVVLTLERLYGLPAVGHGRICFVFSVRSSVATHAPMLWTVAGKLFFGGSTQYVAEMPPSFGGRGPAPGTYQPITVEAPVQYSQLRIMDRGRNSIGGTTLLPALCVHVGQQVLQASSMVRVDVNASDWNRLLSEMNWQDRASFDVPVAGDRLDVEPLNQAASFLRDAIQQRDTRHWRDAVGQCREVLHALESSLSLTAPPRREWCERDASGRPAAQGWTMKQRIEFIREVVEHATNVAHHREVGDPDPDEARLLVALSALLLNYYSER